MLPITRAAPAPTELLTEKVCAVLVVPSAWLVKVMLGGLTDGAGIGVTGR